MFLYEKLYIFKKENKKKRIFQYKGKILIILFIKKAIYYLQINFQVIENVLWSLH